MEPIMIDKLAAMVGEEMQGAAKYMHCALNYKQSHPKVAAMFHEMAEQEMDHLKRLQDTAAVELRALMNAYQED